MIYSDWYKKERSPLDEEKLRVTEEDMDNRLDIYLAEQYEELSRSYIQKLIKEGHIKVNGKVEKAKYLVKVGDEVEILLPKKEETLIEPENIPLDIVYEDEDVLVVNKPQGMVVHPAPGNYSATLVNALMYHCGSNLSDLNGIVRPGIVHRIDKDTSGLLVVAKNNKAHEILAKQFKEHTNTRKYHAIVIGSIKEDEAAIDAPIGRHPVDRLKRTVISDGKHAVTHFRVLNRFRDFTYIEARLETGRAHQIRVHLSYIGNPLLGDPLYGPKTSKFNLKGQVLHAKTLGFVHPRKGEYMEFESELPEYFKKLLKVLKNSYSKD